jgi:hypothetical protein
MPPLPNILANENLHLRAWIVHFMMIATINDTTGMMRV